MPEEAPRVTEDQLNLLSGDITHEKLDIARATLAERGLEGLGNKMISDHQGNMHPLEKAIAMCGRPVLKSLDATVATVKETAAMLGHELTDEQLSNAMTRHLDKMGEKAKDTDVPSPAFKAAFDNETPQVEAPKPDPKAQAWNPAQ